MNNRQAPTPHRRETSLLVIGLLPLLAGLWACSPVPDAASPAATATPTATAAPSPLPTATQTASPAPPSPIPLPECVSQTGQVVEGSLPAQNIFKRQIVFRVYLPPCYGRDPAREYPVLYLFHGLFYTEDQWLRLGLAETADNLISNGEAPPFLAVLPYDPANREPAEHGFDEAVLEALVPYIDETYQTNPVPASRAVGGLSRGAGWAIHLAFTHPDLFGVLGAHSAIVFYEDGGKLATWLSKIPAGQMPRIYMDIGDRDPEAGSAEWLHGLLVEDGIAHDWHVFPGSHTETYWAAHVDEYLRWYASGWVTP